VTGGAPGRPDDAAGFGPGDAGTGGDHGRPAPGAPGEELAARWYEGQGYEVLERNWRRREGEVDLIVRRGATVVFVEVETRATGQYGTGTESAAPAKQRRIRRLAARWLSELTPAVGRSRVEARFDVVSMTAGELDVVENAF
jgi:putative endonuclease